MSENYQRFKNIFSSKHEKKPKPIKGIDGMYSLKGLSEVIRILEIRRAEIGSWEIKARKQRGKSKAFKEKMEDKEQANNIKCSK